MKSADFLTSTPALLAKSLKKYFLTFFAIFGKKPAYGCYAKNTTERQNFEEAFIISKCSY